MSNPMEMQNRRKKKITRYHEQLAACASKLLPPSAAAGVDRGAGGDMANLFLFLLPQISSQNELGLLSIWNSGVISLL
jgi:hypothetical protein